MLSASLVSDSQKASWRHTVLRNHPCCVFCSLSGQLFLSHVKTCVKSQWMQIQQQRCELLSSEALKRQGAARHNYSASPCSFSFKTAGRQEICFHCGGCSFFFFLLFPAAAAAAAIQINRSRESESWCLQWHRQP